MATNEQFEDDDYTDDASLMKDLRRQIRSLSKENAQLSDQLGSYKSGERERSVSDVLAKYGAKAALAKFIPSDVEGEDAIKGWLEENAEAFGINPGSANPQVAASTIDPSVVEETKRVQALGQSAISPSQVQDFEQRIANAKSTTEINQIMQEWQKSSL